MTDPLELATTATIIGRISSLAVNAILLIRKSKHRGIFSSGSPLTARRISMEDCFGAYTIASGLVIFDDAAVGAITKNCTFCITFGYSGARTILLADYGNSFNNCIFLAYDSVNDITVYPVNNPSLNNVFYNYAGSKTIVLFEPGSPWSVTNLIGNPNLFDGVMVASAGETPATIIARDAHLTSGSSLCRDNADPATATATDIVGVGRG